MLELIQVGRFFGHFQALKQINLKVEEGEFRGLIGPNGSGKTTLFNVISVVYNASEGRVKFLGRGSPNSPRTRFATPGSLGPSRSPGPFGR